MKKFYGLGYPFSLSVKGGLNMCSDVDKINACIRLLLATKLKERVMEVEIGHTFSDYLFIHLDDSLTNMLKFEIVDLITKYEPRVQLDESNITVCQIANDDGSVTNQAIITYQIIGLDTDGTLNYNLGGDGN